jgi:hypothetical protein
MSVNYIPLESKSGFRSPGFSVDELGNLTVTGAVSVAGSIDTTGSFKINGIPLQSLVIYRNLCVHRSILMT